MSTAQTALDILDSEPLDVRKPSLSEAIDKAFAGRGDALLTHLVDYREEEEDFLAVAYYIKVEEGERDMEHYNTLCFMYACFILLSEGEEF